MARTQIPFRFEQVAFVAVHMRQNGFKLTIFITHNRIVTLFGIKMTNDNQFTGVTQSIICHMPNSDGNATVAPIQL